MVTGLQKFREHFRGYEREFVLIGGAACDEWFSARNLHFRATKDLDIVLIIEALTPVFLRHFWEFVQAGQYQTRQRASGADEYFRFLNPEHKDYPAKIELFSRKPAGLKLFKDQDVIPIRKRGDISSLSAILVNEDYYSLILKTREIQDDLSMIRADGLIPLKARAWLDLVRRKKAGEHIDTDDIRKHRNDVFRLALTLPTGGQFPLSESIRADLEKFIEAFPVESSDWPGILNSLRVTFRKPPKPESIRRVLISYFAL